MHRPLAISALVVMAAAPFFGAAACSKVEPEPSSATASASASSVSPSVAVGSALASAASDGGGLAPFPPVLAHSGKLERDPQTGHLKPSTPAPSDDPSQIPPKPQREPDFDLDLDDPSRDYVTRYVQATKRYGDKSDCVAYGKSFEKAGRRAVEVRDDPKSRCGGASDALKDTFLVDVGADRMKLDDPKGHAPLAKWPDGSEPDSKPGAVTSFDDLKAFKSPLADELNKMKLTVVRLQMYGRGSYPVVTLAGWRDPIGANAKPDDLKPVMATLCQANGNRPFSVFGGVNRSTTLRVRCPSGDARWDKL